VWLMLGWLGCGLAGGNDLWLDVRSDDADKVQLHLPANWILDGEGAVDLDTPDGRIDLREEALRLRRTPGAGSRSWTLDEGDAAVTLTLRELRPAPGVRASQLRIGTRGPKGFGLGLTVPLDAEREQRCAEALSDHVEVEQIDVQLGPSFCAQLARSAPTTLVEVSGGGIGAITIETVAP